jgi:hypothetical protein
MQVVGIVMTGLVSGNHDSGVGIWEVLTLRKLKSIFVMYSSYLTENAVYFD